MPTDSIVPTPRQPAPDPPPQAALPSLPLFSAGYAAAVYARRYRAVLAVQAELAAAARAGRPREGQGDAPCK